MDDLVTEEIVVKLGNDGIEPWRRSIGLVAEACDIDVVSFNEERHRMTTTMTVAARGTTEQIKSFREALLPKHKDTSLLGRGDTGDVGFDIATGAINEAWDILKDWRATRKQRKRRDEIDPATTDGADGISPGD